MPQFKAEPESHRGSEFRWWSEIVACRDVVMLHKAYTGDWWVVHETDDEALLVILPLSGGRSDARIGVEDVTAGPGVAILTPASLLRRLDARCRPRLATATLVFQSAAVARVLSSMFEVAVLSKFALAPLFDLSTGPGITFRLLFETIVSGLRGDRALERSPKAMALLAEAALRLVFENVPHRYSGRLHGRLLTVAPRHVIAAMDFMHANIHLPITVIDIAAAAGTSERSLYNGFTLFRDTTPIAYLRQIRLQAVHAELSLSQNRLPIREVALKWGFCHMGRFAMQYKAAYGVKPSETARSAGSEISER